jgi:hypothetical protein
MERQIALRDTAAGFNALGSRVLAFESGFDA